MIRRQRWIRIILFNTTLISLHFYSCDAFLQPIRHRPLVETRLHFIRYDIANSNCTETNKKTEYTTIMPPRISKSRTAAYPLDRSVENERGPFPMPSSTFLDLAKSQFELLSNSIQYRSYGYAQAQENERHPKIKSIALYLPQENPKTGQLEFMPSLVFPSHPKSERIFIASDAKSGIATTIPPALSQLPGFSHAASLLPAYPFTGDDGGSGTVGTPEEVFCDINSGQRSSTALSLPLFSGPQTIGILLIWGTNAPDRMQGPMASMWTQDDKNQFSRVGETLALALCMDSERFKNQIHTEKIRVAMADNLHQVKNPVQALRTFSKLLQRNIATKGSSGNVELSRLADDIITQSERVVDLLLPFDSILNSMENQKSANDEDGLNSYQRLLAPMERTDLVFTNDKSMQTKSYLGSLSGEEEQKKSSSLVLKSSRSSGGDVLKQAIKLEMSFIPDVLQPIFSPSKAMATDLGICMEVIGDGDNSELPGVTLCPKRLQEAVVNVLDNAIKYVTLGENGVWGATNKYPKIRVTLQSNDDDIPPGVTLLVEDNGPGIPLKERDSIFQRGYRGENTSSSTKGTGLGLDISQAMVRSMGGSLELVHNQPEYLKGTVMQFILYRKPNI